MKHCPYCGRENAQEASRCLECGTSLAPLEQKRGIQPLDWAKHALPKRVKLSHHRALSFATTHFFLSTLIAGFCYIYAFSSGLSDVPNPDPLWFKAIEATIIVLQFPLFLLGAITRRHGEIWAAVGIPALLASACVWSTIFGYLLEWVTQQHKQRRNNRGVNPVSG